ncbi:hypothetical protein ACT009_14780 [Sphingomonas sp. Tas61C01]|uniref:hypothetical protein n=1 Tax=Sphingomonas sp. Tas61C01 TaxID=3458297 RepID=UPI00403ED67F
MFGFHDYTTDSRSGRPQPHYSWTHETVATWTAWALAAVFLVGALALYLHWHTWEGPTQMALASLLLAGTAYWRHDMLARKLTAFRDAVEDYEAMLEKPFG